MKICRTLAVPILLFSLFINTQSLAGETGENVIGFIPMSMGNEYFVIMLNAARAEAERQNVELLVKSGESHRSGQEQEDILEAMMTSGVDAICIVPSSGGVIRKLRKVQQANIPIINIDTKIDPNSMRTMGLKTIPYIGTNNFTGARMGGEYAVNRLGIAGKKVAILIGISQQQNAKDRRGGFKAAVGNKAEIVAERPANWEKDLGYAVFIQIFNKNPDLDFVFACNDNMALGAIEAIREIGRKDIVVMGYDGISIALNAIEEGTLAATVAQMPAEMGIKGVQMALALIKGDRIPEITYTETKVIDSYNVAEFKAYLNQYR